MGALIVAPAPPRLAAGIVLFRPDPRLLLDLVTRLGAPVETIYLFCNSPLDGELRANLIDAVPAPGRLHLIEAHGNLGLGVGLNLIAAAALFEGFERLILFDQDSRGSADLVRRLAETLGRLTAAGRQPAAIGPRLVVPASESDSKAPRYRQRPKIAREGAAVPVDFLPTSGSLFDLALLRRTGLFRADYFIDAIDLEWSFRAWAQGASCWLLTDAEMEHTVGTGTIALPFGRKMPNQKPFRMYCHLRNTIYGFRLAHVPLGWKARQAAYMAVQILSFAVHHRWASSAVTPLCAGLRDGVLGRLGVPPPESGL